MFLGILDRYLLKNFLLFFAYSMFGILGIWLVYQMGVEGPRFLELHLSFRVIALYYLAQVPYMVVLWMPLAVLLGLLYVLTRMSRRNDTPVALKASTISPRWRMRAMMAEAAAVLPASMQVPASATTGTPRTSSGAS